MAQQDLHYTHVACSFCAKRPKEVKKIIAGPSVYICDECITICNEIIARDRKEGAKERSAAPVQRFFLKPHEIKERLDHSVYGQEAAKKALCVALFNHYKRIDQSSQSEVELQKSNVLMVGPTGCGKTLLVQSAAKIVDVPFTIVDATTLTEAGYVGEDVEHILAQLIIAADYDVAKAERGIVYIDEIDKLARKSQSAFHARDIGGEGVQQALLKLLEGSQVKVNIAIPKHLPQHGGSDSVTIDTSNILFICGGAFEGINTLMQRRRLNQHIGFQPENGAPPSPSKQPLRVETGDLLQFGLIPELVGRLPIIASLQAFNAGDLTSILQEPKNALTKQYERLFEMDGIRLKFQPEALAYVAQEALKLGTGARGLRAVLEDRMLELMYQLPKRPDLKEIEECIITPMSLCGEESPRLTLTKRRQAA